MELFVELFALLVLAMPHLHNDMSVSLESPL
jgi:hypothetical protein